MTNAKRCGGQWQRRKKIESKQKTGKGVISGLIIGKSFTKEGAWRQRRMLTKSRIRESEQAKIITSFHVWQKLCKIKGCKTDTEVDLSVLDW